MDLSALLYFHAVAFVLSCAFAIAWDWETIMLRSGKWVTQSEAALLSTFSRGVTAVAAILARETGCSYDAALEKLATVIDDVIVPIGQVVRNRYSNASRRKLQAIKNDAVKLALAHVPPSAAENR